ncbi:MULTISPECIES: LAGLIDADG family homing endonuclease [unclassified Streptomyces]|uniref:LAGLIDADG family homing endonuclease n=1 Tax=Streptomyces sp. NRRL F-4428 TaxID=1609137 RepID=UPI0005EC7B7E|nr:LAGLIDADG family homing endonuclease [Streptomyces sp. NRRL F-4428]KJK53175.1 hypothetical protein UK14_07395 [Streptomyces sp. NRRL F-4428]
MADQDPSAPTRFMDLQDPRYAYMFGFLQADGHLAQGSGRKGKLTAEVNTRDIEILREFQRITPYYSSISERTRATNFSESHTSATWSLFSLEARSTLNGLGLPYGRKSLNIRPPRVEFSRRDYLRGVIDADGSVGYTSTGLPFVSLTTASTALGAYLCHYAKKITGAERTIKRNARDGIYNILYTKEAAQGLAVHLYYEGCLGLERKKDKAAAIRGWVRPTDMRVAPPRRRWSPQDDETLLRLNDPATAAVALDRTEQSCNMRLWRLRTRRA